MIKLLIFDLDGTLTDTAQDITDAINYALSPYCRKRYSIEETKAMVGSGISRLLESLVSGTGVCLKAEENNAGDIALERFLEFYSVHLLDNTKLYPGVKDTLLKLGNFRKIVLSNKREKYSKRILDGLGIDKCFEDILGSDSVPEKKPSPVAILNMLEKFGLSKDEAVIIGDSNFDIEAGKAAGIRVIGVTYGFRSRDSLTDADFIIDNFDELLNVIQQINV
jgi:phosphoglycolate phosphatase